MSRYPSSQILIPLFLMLIGFSIGKWVCNSPPPKPQYFEKPGFKPDTIRKPTYKPDTLKKGVPIPPKEVVEYEDPPKYTKPDTVWIDTSRIVLVYKDKELGINMGYITYQPGAPKLLAGKFTGQGFSLDLLDTSGTIRTLKYQTDYSLYDYGYNGQSVTYAKSKRNTIKGVGSKPSNFSFNSNVYLGYEIFSKVPIIAIDASGNFKKIGIYTRASTNYSPVLQQMGISTELGLKLRIK